MRNASGHQGKNELQWEKMIRNTYHISSIKRLTREFVEVSRCSRAKQRQKNVAKSAPHVQSCLFLFLFFSNRSRYRHRFYSSARFHTLFE